MSSRNDGLLRRELGDARVTRYGGALDPFWEHDVRADRRVLLAGPRRPLATDGIGSERRVLSRRPLVVPAVATVCGGARPLLHGAPLGHARIWTVVQADRAPGLLGRPRGAV